MENTELIFNAVNFAKQNATESGISVEEVAKNAGFSMDYFNRIFLSHTGFTVTAYINYIRLKQAAFLLRTTDKSVLDTALEIGYDSHEGFTKAYKKNSLAVIVISFHQNLFCSQQVSNSLCNMKFNHR